MPYRTSRRSASFFKYQFSYNSFLIYGVCGLSLQVNIVFVHVCGRLMKMPKVTKESLFINQQNAFNYTLLT